MADTDFQHQLNPEQLQAATAPDGPILVLAAAGTGKTRTLVFRVAHLVQRGIPAERILLLTFTNKAAREMLDRAHAIVGGAVGGIWGGTFHHLANRLLRRHAARLGFASDFVILDRDDSRGLVAQCLKERKLDGTDFPKPTVLLGLFSMAANSRTPMADLLARRLPEADPSVVDSIRMAYEARKRGTGAMDFDDLLRNGLRLLQEHPDLLRSYQQQFQHVLVDEYQDTNPIQAELVDRLGEGFRNVFVVGDDFQSIYSWRGADFRNIMSFPDRYTGAQVYRLETNYRSAPEILAVANACIAGNPEQFQKVLRPTREAYRRPRVAHVRDGDDQARYVVEQIRRLRREGYPLSDIAVLYRAHYHALELERLLPQVHLPYVITSGMRFFEQAHVKDVCSLLRVMIHPPDELAFTRLVGLLPGVGARTAMKAWVRLGARFNAGDPAHREVVRAALGQRAGEDWKKLERVFEVGITDVSGDEIVEVFLREFYDDYLYNTFENAEQRVDDVNALTDDLARHESTEGFLNDVALLTNVDADEADEEGAVKESLRLSTVHQAKGLEWGVVIVLWATEGMFPSTRSLNETVDGESEERRLFYVAVTRAKDELILCVPEVRRMRDGGTMYCVPSRFVSELPAPLLEQEHAGFL